MSQENVDLVRLAFDAINRRNADELLDMAAPDLVVDWSRAVGPERGTFRGGDEVRRLLASWWEAFDESVIVVDDLIDAGDQVVAPFHGRQRGRGSGAVVEGPGSVLVWRFLDGKLVATTLYQNRAEALAAVGLSGQPPKSA
jgi:ketosteroid isomerase-like protein